MSIISLPLYSLLQIKPYQRMFLLVFYESADQYIICADFFYESSEKCRACLQSNEWIFNQIIKSGSPSVSEIIINIEPLVRIRSPEC